MMRQKQKALAALLAAGLSGGWFAPLPAAAAAAPGDDAVAALQARYRACARLALSDPPAGLLEAEDWTRAGGGMPAQHCRATALFGVGRYSEAGEAFEATAAKAQDEPSRARLMSQSGRAWLQAGAAERALAAFDRALQATPGDAQLLVDRAEAEAALGRDGAAIEDLSLALIIEPGLTDALVLRASAARRTGQRGQAAADLATVLAREPANADALLERGLLQLDEGDAAAARRDWLAVLAAAPGSAAAEAASRHLTGASTDGGTAP